MQNPEELAQEALKFLELAQKYEQEKKSEKAISTYQKAAEFLKQSGYLTHRIDEIYERIEELRSFLKQEKKYQQTQIQAQSDQLQDQAFSLLEGAKKLEADGFFEDSVQQYNSAINLLNQAGWSEAQLENLRLKIKNLSDILKNKIKIQEESTDELSPSDQFLQESEEKSIEVVDIFGQKSSFEKTESILNYRTKRKKVEDIQTQAFEHIDSAKIFERKRKFNQAILNYERAIELLDSIGWNEQTKNILVIINKLKIDKKQFEQFQDQQQPTAFEKLEKSVQEKAESEQRKTNLIEFEERKNREETIQAEAFNLIDRGKRFEREKDYENAIKILEQAIDLFKSIEWDSYIHPIINLIEDIKLKREREQKAAYLREKREKDLNVLQESIYRKQKEQILESAKELELRKTQFEEKREDSAQKEKNLFTVLSGADTLLQERQFEKAVNMYQQALKLVENLGPGWETYSSNINNTISNVEKIKETQLKKIYESQQSLENKEKAELEFQKQIANQLQKERNRLKQKEIVLRDKEKEIGVMNQQKNKAFELLDAAINSTIQGDYENALIGYHNVGNIFAEIQWKDEIPLIENSIREVEELQREQAILKQVKLQEAILRQKEEEKFQTQISQHLQREKEKLKKQEIKLKERDEELKFREERREGGFKLLDEAQIEVDQGNFDKGIEILQYATTFFADAQWQDEIRLIQNSILEIESKKRESELQAQIKFQTVLEREKQERLFQEQIGNETKARQEKLKQKEFIIREREKEIAYRELRKSDAFNLLEKGQNLVLKGDYDEVLEIYYEVLNIFAQIQWTEEIPIIREAIQDIENKKREDLLHKQKQLENNIKNEASERAFIEQIKHQREREKLEETRNLKFLESQKMISAQNLAKKEEAFKMIEEGEVLLKGEKYDEATENYQKAIDTLKTIGWGAHYLKLLNETVDTVKTKKLEKARSNQAEFQVSLKRQDDEEQFQKKIIDYMKEEKDRINAKEIQIQKQEEKLHLIERRKTEAFDLIDIANDLLAKGQYDKSIETYRQAELSLNEIGFPTEVVRETIQKVQEKRREEETQKFKELESKIREEQEDLLFQQMIAEEIRLDKLKMREKQENLKKEEEYEQLVEEKKEKAFLILDQAQDYIESGEFDNAITQYHKAAEIFNEIQWEDEAKLVHNSIIVVEEKKWEAELIKQRELEEILKEERLEKAFQEQITRETLSQQEKIQQKEIVIRKEEKELAYREEQKNQAFILLDKAQTFLSQGKYDDVLTLYYEAVSIFAQIQWTDEISVIQEAIKEIENRKKEKDLMRQNEFLRVLDEEKANYAFLDQIKFHQQREKEMAMREVEILEREKRISAQNLIKQNDAFKLIDAGDVLLKQNNFDYALERYNQAITVLSEIGWTSDYLKLLHETIYTIESRKKEIEKSNIKEQEMLAKQKEMEEKFQLKISENVEREKQRLKKKQIEIQKREELLKNMEFKKSEAFDLMDQAEKLLNSGQFEKVIYNYRQAELLLDEIGFPTGAIKEMVLKIQEKLRDDIIKKEKSLEKRFQREREELRFNQRIAEDIRLNDLRMKEKQKKLEKRKDYYEYMENRKNQAFDLLEEAEMYMNQAQYDKSLEYYHSAEIILNEIAFPTESIREMINNVQEKRNEFQLQKQKDVEVNLLKEREEWEFQQVLATQMKDEKERLQFKQVQLEEMEKLKTVLEERKQEAFKFLDKAETFLNNKEYNNAIESYRKAELILSELKYPTDAISNMIFKVKKIKKQREEMGELKYQRELEKLHENRELQLLIEERQRQEREKRKAHAIALQEREKIIQNQLNIRESAYSLLEEAGIYLKQHQPEYDKAISLYAQARNILADNIGWEPEINNLNVLIKDLQQEQINYIEKKRVEEQNRVKREREYEIFQEEVKLRRLEQEKLKREQERQYRELILSKRHIDQIKGEGLNLLDEGKKLAVYHDFEGAIKSFERAIAKFTDIGWVDEIKYIEAEIKNTKNLEDRARAEESRIQKIQEQLEKQRILEENRRTIEETQLKQTIGEVSNLAGDITKLITQKKELKKLEKEQKAKELLYEAKDFRKKMGDLIKIKQELLEEIENKEVKERDLTERLEKAKKREEIDNLKRMIKEAGKEKKK
ncbi:MAG: hypothetical protein ACXABO_20415 [Promethearchaeota archaeon]|jgi:tetratricopeptide (TPR) repeat protein